MGKVIWGPPPGPDDPIFKEPPRSYSPHWARAYLESRRPPPIARPPPPRIGPTPRLGLENCYERMFAMRR